MDLRARDPVGAVNGYLYAAYNAAPATLSTDSRAEDQWYALLRGEPLIGGLELSFNGTFHPKGVSRLAGLLDPKWACVVTDVPGTIENVKRDPRYGLASTDIDSRARAVDDVRSLLIEIHRLHERIGEPVVAAVELHSAPMAMIERSSKDIFADSLAEIASWSWGPVELVIEHADALVDAHPPQKGYLALAAEIEAAGSASARSGRAIGHSVNWGRSAIEAGSSAGPEEHVRALASRSLLRGLMFSGASARATDWSEPWQDSHLPIAEREPNSLLTVESVRASLMAARTAKLEFLGVKVGAGVVPDDSLAARLAPGLATLAAVDAVSRAMSH
ncbi:MAG: DUF4862 family protein [Actinomycetota bacterium]